MILNNIFLLKFESIMHQVHTQYYEARLQTQLFNFCHCHWTSLKFSPLVWYWGYFNNPFYGAQLTYTAAYCIVNMGILKFMKQNKLIYILFMKFHILLRDWVIVTRYLLVSTMGIIRLGVGLRDYSSVVSVLKCL